MSSIINAKQVFTRIITNILEIILPIAGQINGWTDRCTLKIPNDSVDICYIKPFSTSTIMYDLAPWKAFMCMYIQSGQENTMQSLHRGKAYIIHLIFFRVWNIIMKLPNLPSLKLPDAPVPLACLRDLFLTPALSAILRWLLTVLSSFPTL